MNLGRELQLTTMWSPSSIHFALCKCRPVSIANTAILLYYCHIVTIVITGDMSHDLTHLHYEITSCCILVNLISLHFGSVTGQDLCSQTVLLLFTVAMCELITLKSIPLYHIWHVPYSIIDQQHMPTTTHCTALD